MTHTAANALKLKTLTHRDSQYVIIVVIIPSVLRELIKAPFYFL